MSYTYFINDNQACLINLDTGHRTVFHSDHPRFSEFKSLIRDELYESAENMDAVKVVKDFFGSTKGFKVNIEDGVGSIKIGKNTYPLANAIVERMLKMTSDGFDCQPMVNFLSNLYKNPSKSAIDELYLFLDSCSLPITEDGCFIAYKIVRKDYKDVYSGKFDNSIGKVCEMQRFEVDDKRDNTCSNGLHFCSREYLSHYGSSDRNTDRCMLIKINPADVVSIPSDYNNAKGRTCRYEVIGEADEGWRKELQEQDYTDCSVVDSDGDDFDNDYYNDSVIDEHNNLRYVFDTGVNRWRDVETGKIVSYQTVKDAQGE